MNDPNIASRSSALRRATAAIASAVILAACGGPSAVEILRVTDVGPRQVEIGDRVEVVGQHFPQASELERVRLTLRATLARAGMPPCPSPVEVTITDPPEGSTEFDATTQQMRAATYARSARRNLRLDGPDRLAFVLSESLFDELTRCPGERDSAPVDHSTLSFGSTHARYARLGITVRFEGAAGTHAIEGTLRGATLDLLAPASRRVQRVETLRRRATRVIDALGVTLADAHPTTGGLRIASVRNGGPAWSAGIGANDVLTSIDALTVFAIEDLAVPENTRAVRLSVARDDIVDERLVALEGFATASPKDLLSASIAMLVAALAVALALRPAPGALASLSRVAQRALGAEGRVAFGPWWRERSRDVLHGRADRDVIAYLAVAAPVTALGLSPLLPPLLRLGWDVGLLYALGAGLRWMSGPPLSWRTMAKTIPLSIASILALVTAVAASGTFRAEGIVGAQGAAPWTWHAFRSPASLTLAVLYIVALCAGAPERRPRTGDPSRAAIVRDAAGWLGTLLAAASGAAALFGGWQVPGTNLGQQEASAALQMSGALLFLCKAWALTLCAAWLRWTSSSARSNAMIKGSSRILIVAAVVAACAHCALALLSPKLPAALTVLLAHSTFALAVLAILAAIATPLAARSWGLAAFEPPVFGRAEDSVCDRPPLNPEGSSQRSSSLRARPSRR